MQRVTLICVGKLKEKFYAEAAAEYVSCILELVDTRVDRALLRMVADGQIDQVELPVFEALMDLAARANKAYYEIRFAKGRES